MEIKVQKLMSLNAVLIDSKVTYKNDFTKTKTTEIHSIFDS